MRAKTTWDVLSDIAMWLSVRGSKKESETENKQEIELRSLASFIRGTYRRVRVWWTWLKLWF